MNPGGDTADQMMKMTLEGIEVAARVVLPAGGSASKSLAATLYAILTDNKKYPLQPLFQENRSGHS